MQMCCLPPPPSPSGKTVHHGPTDGQGLPGPPGESWLPGKNGRRRPAGEYVADKTVYYLFTQKTAYFDSMSLWVGLEGWRSTGGHFVGNVPASVV